MITTNKFELKVSFYVNKNCTDSSINKVENREKTIYRIILFSQAFLLPTKKKYCGIRKRASLLIRVNRIPSSKKANAHNVAW